MNAHFTLLRDGNMVREATVDTSAWEYRFTIYPGVDPATGHDLLIRYDNDGIVNGEDRNLTVMGIAVNGHAVAGTDRAELFWNGALV